MNAMLLKYLAKYPIAVKFAVAAATGRFRAYGGDFIGVIPECDKRRPLLANICASKRYCGGPHAYEIHLNYVALGRLGYKSIRVNDIAMYVKQIGNYDVYHYRTEILGQDTFVPTLRVKLARNSDEGGTEMFCCVSIKHRIQMKLSTALYGSNYDEFRRLLGWDWTIFDELKCRWM